MMKLYVSGSILFSLMVAGQANAAFFFCASKLKSDYALSPKEAETLCNSTFSNDIKLSREKETPADVKKTLKILLAADVEPTYIKFEDAVKRAKTSSDEEVEFISVMSSKYNFQEGYGLLNNLDEEKKKIILSNKDEIKRSAGQSSSSIAEVREFIHKASIEQIKALPKYMRRYPEITMENGNKAVKLLAGIPEEKVEFSASIIGNYSGSPSEFYRYMKSTDMGHLSCIAKLGYKSEDLCTNYEKAELCGPKLSMLETLMANNQDVNVTQETVENFNKYDHFTANHSKIFEKLLPLALAKNDKSLIYSLLTRESLADKDVQRVLEEMESPVLDLAFIKKTLEDQPSVFESGIEFNASDSAAAGWGHGSGPACDTSKGIQAFYNAKDRAIANCEAVYRTKKSLECSVSRKKFGGGDMICNASVTVVSKFLKSNLKSCTTEEFVKNLKALNDKAKVVTNNEINDSKMVKENETSSSTDGQKKTKTTAK